MVSAGRSAGLFSVLWGLLMPLPARVAPAWPAPGGLGAEDRLHDSLLRLAGCAAGFYAVHVPMACAPGAVGGLERRGGALRPLELLVTVHEAKLFCLSTGDVVLVCKDSVPVDQVDAAVSEARALPLESIERRGWDGQQDPEAEWYDLAQAEDLERLLSLAAAWAATARRGRAVPVGGEEVARVRCLKAEDLGAICQQVEKADLGAMVRQQTALDVLLDAPPVPLFRETYVSMQDLNALVAPGIDMFASKWLFRYLTEILDRRMLDSIAEWAIADGSVPISLNLNISSLGSPSFKQFLDRCGMATSKPIVEIQLVDLLANSLAFAKIRQSLQERGYRILIDGLTPLTLQAVDVFALRPDFVKIWWQQDAPTLFPPHRVSGLRDVIDRIGRERVILARTQSEQALEWGLEHGIRRFQGQFVDRLLDALAGKKEPVLRCESTDGNDRAPRP